MITRIRKDKFNYFIIFLLLFTSVDTILFGTNADKIMNYIPRIVSVFAILLFLLSSKYKNNYSFKIEDYVLVCLVFFIFVSSIINSSDFGSIISRLLFILTAFLIVKKIKLIKFMTIYDDFIFLVCLFAILLEFTVYIYPSFVANNAALITNTANGEFYSFYVASIMKTFVGTTIIRASGIFWEPGAFSVYIIFGLIYQLFLTKRINVLRVILYSLSLILTFSTTGIVAYIMLLIAFIFNDKSRFSKRVRNTVSVLVILVTISFVLLLIIGTKTTLYSTLFGKILSNNDSARARWASFFVPFIICFNYPLFGVGPNRISASMREYSGSFLSQGLLTNTTTYQFAAFGFICGLCFVVGLFRLSNKCAGRRPICTLFFFLTIISAFFGENLFSFFPYILVFYGFCSEKIQETINENSFVKFITKRQSSTNNEWHIGIY